MLENLNEKSQDEKRDTLELKVAVLENRNEKNQEENCEALELNVAVQCTGN